MTDFIQISPVFLPMFFFCSWIQPIYHIAFSCRVSLLYSNCDSFLVFTCFCDLATFEAYWSRILYGVPQFVFVYVLLQLDWDHGLWGKNTTEMLCPSVASSLGAHDSHINMLTLILLFRWCLPGFSIVTLLLFTFCSLFC